MSDNANPYQSPQADVSPVTPLTSQGGLSENMIAYLRGASPWLRFIGILAHLGCGLMVVLGVLSLAAPGFSLWNGMGGWGTRLGSAVLYAGFALLIFFPGRFTYKFGAMIRNYLRSNSERDLELAFKNNKSLWKFYGITAIVYLAVIPVLVVLGIIAAFTSSWF